MRKPPARPAAGFAVRGFDVTANRLTPFDQQDADKRNALRLAAAERMAQELKNMLIAFYASGRVAPRCWYPLVDLGQQHTAARLALVARCAYDGGERTPESRDEAQRIPRSVRGLR
jgi:hypothetical protein